MKAYRFPLNIRVTELQLPTGEKPPLHNSDKELYLRADHPIFGSIYYKPSSNDVDKLVKNFNFSEHNVDFCFVYVKLPSLKKRRCFRLKNDEDSVIKYSSPDPLSLINAYRRVKSAFAHMSAQERTFTQASIKGLQDCTDAQVKADMLEIIAEIAKANKPPSATETIRDNFTLFAVRDAAFQLTDWGVISLLGKYLNHIPEDAMEALSDLKTSAQHTFFNASACFVVLALRFFIKTGITERRLTPENANETRDFFKMGFIAFLLDIIWGPVGEAIKLGATKILQLINIDEANMLSFTAANLFYLFAFPFIFARLSRASAASWASNSERNHYLGYQMAISAVLRSWARNSLPDLVNIPFYGFAILFAISALGGSAAGIIRNLSRMNDIIWLRIEEYCRQEVAPRIASRAPGAVRAIQTAANDGYDPVLSSDDEDAIVRDSPPAASR